MSATDLAVNHVQFPSRMFASQRDCDEVLAMAMREGVSITLSRQRRRVFGTEQLVRFDHTSRTTRQGVALLDTLYAQIAHLL